MNSPNPADPTTSSDLRDLGYCIWLLGVSSRFLVFNSHFGWVLYAPIDLPHFRYQRQGQDTDLHVQNDWWTIHPIHGWTSTRINWTAGCNSSQKVTVNDNHHPSYLKVAHNTLDTKPGELSRYTSKTTNVPPPKWLSFICIMSWSNPVAGIEHMIHLWKHQPNQIHWTVRSFSPSRLPLMAKIAE